MPAINISDEDIRYAESILLKEGYFFDAERRAFIKNMETLDLQAVPGSGKTTALIAKLLILDRYLPFADGSAILVISHTNAAIDEIKNRIGQHCKRIFNYPNYIGTIQSFVDRFLFMHCMVQKFGTKPTKIDSALYMSEIVKKFKKIEWDDAYGAPRSLFYGRHISRANNESLGDKRKMARILDELIYQDVKDLYFDYSSNCITFSSSKKVLLKDSANLKFKAIKSIIEDVLKEGVVSFEYTYDLAKLYLENNPKIAHFLQKRFRFVFVDEMQDMDEKQYNMLENLFYVPSTDNFSFQRIGDKNQAIYNKSDDLDILWKDRTRVLALTGSHRLSQPVSELVNRFSLTNHTIRGLGADIPLKPHLLVFESFDAEKVIPYYQSLVKDYRNKNMLPFAPLGRITAISWVGQIKADPTKISLATYCPTYIADQPQIRAKSLESYLQISSGEHLTLKSISENIIDGITRALFLSNVRCASGKYFTRSSWLDHMMSNDSYETFAQQLYRWSIGIVRGNQGQILIGIRQFIDNLFSREFPELTRSTDFIHGTCCGKLAPNDGLLKNETKDNTDFYVGTVHSVKGQTHSSTLYMETFVDGRYESELLDAAFNGINVRDIISKLLSDIDAKEKLISDIRAAGKSRGIVTREKEIVSIKDQIKKIKTSSKIMYVGLSRPTHLLCIAIEKSRFDNLNLSHDKWHVLNIRGHDINA